MEGWEQRIRTARYAETLSPRVRADFIACIDELDRLRAAIAAERERCKRAVYDSTDWAHDERDLELKAAIVEWIDK